MKYSPEIIGEIARRLAGRYVPTDVRNILESLEATDEQKGLRADAERYQWLRSHGYKDTIGKQNDCIIFGRGIDQTMPELLDAYLDKAREA